jgi:hypothetical protein
MRLIPAVRFSILVMPYLVDSTQDMETFSSSPLDSHVAAAVSFGSIYRRRFSTVAKHFS